jgi:PAS domain S-box-containing protein
MKNETFMQIKDTEMENILSENKALRDRVANLEETLRAIQHGEVDALVVSTPDGDQIFSISGAETAYRILIEEMNEGAVMLSDSNTVLYCNKGFANIVNQPLDKITSVNIFNFIAPRHVKTFEKLLASGRKGEGTKEKEVLFQTKEGDFVPTHLSVTSLKKGDMKTTFLVATDLTKHMERELRSYTYSLEKEVTERKKAEEALKRSKIIAQKRAEELEKTQQKLEEKAAEVEEYATRMEELAAERALKLKESERLAAIGTTAGMVGHDIRNPLQAIASDVFLAGMELSSLPDVEAKKNIAESLVGINENIDYINKIVQDLQDFARPLTPVTREIDLCALCEEVLFKNGIPEEVDACCQIDKGAEKIISDPDVLRRIIGNLVSNAIQAMPKGGKLGLKASKDHQQVIIIVEDNGVGIPEDVRPKLFTPLFTTKAKGQGFGLAVVKRMVEALGGSVGFESQVGKGTKFIIHLPVEN